MMKNRRVREEEIINLKIYPVLKGSRRGVGKGSKSPTKGELSKVDRPRNHTDGRERGIAAIPPGEGGSEELKET